MLMFKISRAVIRINKYALTLIILFLLVAALNSPYGTVSGQSEEAEYWAIIVGVDDYRSLNFNTEYCAEDANDLAQILRPIYGDDHVILLTGANATNTAVYDAIGNISNKDGLEDTCFFYFTGHSAGRGSYMCTYDPPGQIDIPGIGTVYGKLFNPTKLINPSQFSDAMSKLNSGSIFIVLDMCDSGGFGERLLDERMTILCSSVAGKESWESEDLEGGIFSHFFLEEITKFIDGSGGYLSVEGIYNNVIDPIKSYFREETYGYYEEVPQLIDNDDEEAIIFIKFSIKFDSPISVFEPPIILDGSEYYMLPDDLIWIPNTSHTIEFPLHIVTTSGERYIFISFGGNGSPIQTIKGGHYPLSYVLLPDVDVYSQFDVDSIDGWRWQFWFWSVYFTELGYSIS